MLGADDPNPPKLGVVACCGVPNDGAAAVAVLPSFALLFEPKLNGVDAEGALFDVLPNEKAGAVALDGADEAGV